LIGKKLYAAGWHQGAILDPTLMERLRPHGVAARFTHAVMIAQDCNIVNDEREDRIEVMLGYVPASGQETNDLAQGRNPRLYRTGTTETGLCVWDIRERFTISKTDLSSVLGDAVCHARLMDAELRDVRRWIGRRYTRPAFPDSFNVRISSADKEISKAVKSQEFKSVRGVYYLVTEKDEELPAGRDYHLKIAFCYVYNDSENPLPETKAKIDQYVSAVNGCAGVKLTGVLILSDADFPVSYLDSFSLYDFEARSYADPAAAPPQM
jgi:hypothetical protein